ncbi:hypothetical protein RJ641_016937 [Dillenia turbinata]|uniref:Uncharacterized protein n=1 Tax=Dillenia turbinata TaxID=194707 RepID=A0AAN8UMZ1_9MAGN
MFVVIKWKRAKVGGAFPKTDVVSVAKTLSTEAVPSYFSIVVSEQGGEEGERDGFDGITKHTLLQNEEQQKRKGP